MCQTSYRATATIAASVASSRIVFFLLSFFLLSFFLLSFSTVPTYQLCAAEPSTYIEPTLENPDPNGIIEWTRQVYSNGQWNGSPDIAYWRGAYYAAINQGSTHNGMDGPVIVLRSTDLLSWELIHTTSGAPGNGSAVDCNLAALPERLLLYYVYMHREVNSTTNESRSYAETRATYTKDGNDWSTSQRMYQAGHNFWKPQFHQGTLYVASDFIHTGRNDYVTAEEEKNPQLFRVDLLRSQDGIQWQKVSTILQDAPWAITETALAFRPSGELWAFTRQNFLSRSQPPYEVWKSQGADVPGGGIAGPDLLACGDDVYLTGRFYAYLAKHGPPGSPQTNKFATSLLRYNPAMDRFTAIADLPLPAYADMGYNGLIQSPEGVFILYYSGHAYREANLARGNITTQSDIYLSKLRISASPQEQE